MTYAIRIKPRVKYARTNRSISGKLRGNFTTKETAKKAYLREVRKVNPIAKSFSNKKLLSFARIVKLK
jgi:hypothetical protein